MTTIPQPHRLPLPAGSPTSICECSHDWCMHGQSGWTSRSAICHGWTGNATPGPYEPCRCAGFKPWNGPRDSMTGEPVKPLTVAIDARTPDAATLALLDSAAHRIAELEHLASDILNTYQPTGDGHRGRVGQVQIAKWRKVLDGDDEPAWCAEARDRATAHNLALTRPSQPVTGKPERKPTARRNAT